MRLIYVNSSKVTKLEQKMNNSESFFASEKFTQVHLRGIVTEPTICHLITTACFSLCITTACFSLCIWTLKHADLTSFLMYCLSANLLFFSLLLTNEPPHIKNNTDKYVLSDIHSGDLEIANDHWLLITECMSFLHYFHAAISNHLSEKPKICIVVYGRLTQV